MKSSGYFTKNLKKDQQDHFYQQKLRKDYSDHSYIIIDFINTNTKNKYKNMHV